jgi:antitoxin component YwqK of YwqJK toxin-antitoxin module
MFLSSVVMTKKSFDAVDIKNGIFCFFDELNKCYIECEYINDKLNGQLTKYFRDGTIMNVEYYIDGLKNGSMFFNNNNYVSVEDYVDNKKNGRIDTYVNDSYILHEKYHYVNGKQNGLYEEYFFSYKLLSVYRKWNLLDGKNVGIYEQFHPNGVVQMRSDFEFPFEQVLYDKNGKILQIINKISLKQK